MASNLSVLISTLWSYYFPKETCPLEVQYKTSSSEDKRQFAINILYEFIRNHHESLSTLNNFNASISTSIHIETPVIHKSLPFPDFEDTLRMKPSEVMGCVGIALSCIINQGLPNIIDAVPIIPRFYNLTKQVGFGDIKSGSVGQLVSLRGHVIRVGGCQPIVHEASFTCHKCNKNTTIQFEDGIYSVPEKCRSERCNGKFLRLIRQSVKTGDFQKIKLQELDDQTSQTDEPETAMIPRTLEIEVRNELVNCCIPGDTITVVGIVKTFQIDPPRKGFVPRGEPRKGFFPRNRFRKGNHSSSDAADTNHPNTHPSNQDNLNAERVSSNEPVSDNVYAGGQSKEGGLYQLLIVANSLVCQRSTSSVSFIKPTGDNETHSPFLFLSRNRNDLNDKPSDSVDQESNSDINFSAFELNWIRTFAHQDRRCLPLLIHYFCPTIYGHELVKAGLLLGLFGGSSSEKSANFNGGRRKGSSSFKIRPDIHVLIVGDPGLGKSQMLRSAANMAPRAVFVCGNTTTTAGLTVAISRDSSGQGGSNDLAIEAGALVLADQGVCCIDELDKITCDHHALLEAMEQQSISVAKSGMVASLKSRTSVFAAANPVGGSYNRRKSVCENLKMNGALLSRFDLIFILIDQPEEQHDRRISDHIMQWTARSDPSSHGPSANKRVKLSEERNLETHSEPIQTMSQRLRREVEEVRVEELDRKSNATVYGPLLRRYIEYAKRYVHPVLTPSAAKVLQRLYLNMRSEAALRNGVMPVTTRHLESLIRLAQARARIELRTEVTEEDAQDVAMILQESLLEAQCNDLGIVDGLFGKKGGTVSMAKQVKVLVKLLTKEVSNRGNAVFSRNEICEICKNCPQWFDRPTDEIIEWMRTESYLILKGPKMYQLISV